MRSRRQPRAPPPGSTRVTQARRSGRVLALLFAMAAYSSWSVYRYQFENLPAPLTADQAGKRGFSEAEALKHVGALTQLGPHPVGSHALDLALEYVLAGAEKIKETAHWEVDVQVDLFHVESGVNRLGSGLFVGRTLIYSDLSHVVLRILPKYSTEAEENAILVSSHIDTVFSTGGAGDCSSCVAVMMELARGISQWAHGFKNAVIFLFNTGEEEGLNGAHSFVTQHPWSSTIRVVVDLEAMGVGGKSGIFQAGPQPFAIENFASSAKYPSGHIIAQDLFSSGLIKSGTDFQVYKEIAGLSGLDFAFTDHNYVYHTQNDKLELLKSGSLQHLGENMLAFLLQVGSFSHLPKGKAEGKSDDDNAIFFDILGTYMIVYKQRFASMLHNSVILQSLLIWVTSLLMGGIPGAISLGLSCLSAILMWLFSLSFSVAVAFVLPLFSSPAPYVAYPWLALGLFAPPAVIGALTGQHMGYLILQKYLLKVYSMREQLPSTLQADLIKLEAERWLYKSGSVQWLALLIVGSYYKLGSTYVALFWLVPPAVAYGMLEATLTPARLPKPLKLATLMIGLAVPILTTAGTLIRLVGTMIGIVVRFDRDPGGTPQWLANVQVSLFIAAITCLTLVYIFSYVHLSGATRRIILAATTVFGISLMLVASGAIPPFTEDAARAVNVVHVVDATESYTGIEEPTSYISLFSTTPGKLTHEVEHMKEGFVCGEANVIDLVTFSVKYGCVVHDYTKGGWTKSDIPILEVDSDTKGLERITKVSVDTKASFRWCLAINMKEIEDFIVKDAGKSDELVPLGNKTSVQGWHLIQFSGGKDAPRKFELTLFWTNKSGNRAAGEETNKETQQRPLLKLRTDVNQLTPKAESVMKSLPPWCSLFGKSTSPYSLAFLNNLPINI